MKVGVIGSGNVGGVECPQNVSRIATETVLSARRPISTPAGVSCPIEIAHWVESQTARASPSEPPVQLWRTVTFREHDKQVCCDEEREMHVRSMLFFET